MWLICLYIRKMSSPQIPAVINGPADEASSLLCRSKLHPVRPLTQAYKDQLEDGSKAPLRRFYSLKAIKFPGFCLSGNEELAMWSWTEVHEATWTTWNLNKTPADHVFHAYFWWTCSMFPGLCVFPRPCFRARREASDGFIKFMFIELEATTPSLNLTSVCVGVASDRVKLILYCWRTRKITARSCRWE